MSNKIIRAIVALAVGTALVQPGIARADAITRTFTFPSPLAGYTNASGTPLNQFDSGLGTLDSITVHLTATANWSGGASTDFNDVEYAVFLAGSAFTMGAAKIGDGAAPAFADFNDTTPTVLGALTGLGTVATSVTILNQGGTPANFGSTFGTESVTYNYTPGSTPGVPPITARLPEPCSLLVLAAGLLGLAWSGRGQKHRRRSARCQL
jgi:hypothetical protein